MLIPRLPRQPTAPPGAAPMPSGALPLDDLADAARHGNEFARHHDDRHAGLLGADFGDHLHTAPLATRPILHNDLASAAQLPGRFKLRLRLDQACRLFAQRLGLLGDGALHRAQNFDVLHLDPGAPQPDTQGFDPRFPDRVDSWASMPIPAAVTRRDNASARPGSGFIFPDARIAITRATASRP